MVERDLPGRGGGTGNQTTKDDSDTDDTSGLRQDERFVSPGGEEIGQEEISDRIEDAEEQPEQQREQQTDEGTQGLESESGLDPNEQDAVRELEDQIQDQTPFEATQDDYRITQQNGGFQAKLTESGQRRFAAYQFDRQIGDYDVSVEDVRETPSGEFRLRGGTELLLQRRAEREAAEENAPRLNFESPVSITADDLVSRTVIDGEEARDTSDLRIDAERGVAETETSRTLTLDDETTLAIREAKITEARQQALEQADPEEIHDQVTSQVNEQTPGTDLEAGLDYRYQITDEGTVNVELTPRGENKLDQSQGFVINPEDLDGGFDPTDRTLGETTVGTDQPLFGQPVFTIDEETGEMQEIEPDREHVTYSFAENFGKRVNVGLAYTSRFIDTKVLPGDEPGAITEGGEFLGEQGDEFSEHGIIALSAPLRPGELYDTGKAVADFSKDTATGIATELSSGNVGAAGGEAADAGGEVAGVAKETGEFIIEHPAGTAGSIFFTAGAMALPGKAGAAARYTIQPGEELLTAGASRAFPRVASRFPGGRIDWEEPLVSAGARGLSGTKKAAKGFRNLARGDLPDLAPSPRQRALIEVGRPGTATDIMPERIAVETEGSAPGAQSEPLGGGGERFVDATTEVEPSKTSVNRQPSSVESETGVKARTRKTDPNRELPLLDPIREAGSVRSFLRGEEDVGPRLSQIQEQSALEMLPENVKQLLREDRGQAQLTGRAKPEIEQPDLEFDNFAELEAQRRQEIAQRRELQSDIDAWHRKPDSRIQTRQRRGRRSEVETETDADVRVRAAEVADIKSDVQPSTNLDTFLNVNQTVDPIKAGRPELGQEVKVDVETEQEFEQAFEQAFEFESRTETEFGLELAVETELEQEQDPRALGFDLPNLDDTDDIGLPFSIETEVGAELTSFVDPVTGEVIETELDE